MTYVVVRPTFFFTWFAIKIILNDQKNKSKYNQSCKVGRSFMEKWHRWGEPAESNSHVFVFCFFTWAKCCRMFVRNLRLFPLNTWIRSPLLGVVWIFAVCSQHSPSRYPHSWPRGWFLCWLAIFVKYPLVKYTDSLVMWCEVFPLYIFFSLSFSLTSAVPLSSIAWVTCCRNSQHAFCMRLHFWPRSHLYVNMSPPIQLCSQFKQSN